MYVLVYRVSQNSRIPSVVKDPVELEEYLKKNRSS
jgi:hypothetical protein